MRSSCCAVLFAVFMALSPVLWAHPGNDGHPHEPPTSRRLWKDSEGNLELEATFVLAREGQVLLAGVDGADRWLPMQGLSRADREWVARRLEEIRVLNEVIPSFHARVAPPARLNAKVSLPWAFGALVAVASVGVLVRRRPESLSWILVVAAPLCLMSACSRREEGREEIVATSAGPPPAIVAHFKAFHDQLKFRWNDEMLFIDSNGLPDHPMMVGITNWQQQVPLPQPYTGNNAWRIPLRPRMAERPISARNALSRGAIALAVNGVPIFNALNNRGEDAFLIGELDEYGGHCGKGDDYHYHAAPLHLQKAVGEGNPIGYALDGFPLFGLTDQKLDEFNGRYDDQGNYRYHSTKTYPYINGGLKGVVQVRDDGVEPQPRAAPVRPATSPLRGARITGFSRDEERGKYSLEYEVKGQRRAIRYAIEAGDSVRFVFVDERGQERTETYRRRDGEGKDKKGEPKKKKGPEKKSKPEKD